VTRVCVLGAGGFIGGHLVRALLERGDEVVAADLKLVSDWEQIHSDSRPVDGADLRNFGTANGVMSFGPYDEVYALAADMGGMGYLTYHEADVMTSNLLIDANVIRSAAGARVPPKLVYASSACVYPEYRQESPDVTPLAEDMAWPAQPDLAYGFEKLTTEQLLAAYRAESRLDVRIARFHNIFGPLGSWHGGREKAPAALCRKAAEAADGSQIEVWGDGQQTRSFCYIDDAIEGLLALAASDFTEPLNIGSDRLVTIDELAQMAIAASRKTLGITHVEGPQGVRGRNADLALCRKVTGWEPRVTLEDGMARTYEWIAAQVPR
jgi:GDP-D-mannose 3', 5'-epimerase